MNQSYYYAEAIEWPYRNGIVDGYAANAFGPDDLVTRQQMCKIVSSYLTWLETPLAPGESCEGKFADYDQLAGWALEPVNAMVAAGLIQGDGTNLNPNNGTNRAQFCVVLLRLVDYIDNYVPLEPEPTEPEPTEPEHIHDWKLNKASGTSENEGDVSINVGESFYLRVYCRGKGCSEIADVTWSPSTEGVVAIDGNRITGVKAGWNTWLSTELDGETFRCLIRVRSKASSIPVILLPM